MAYSCEVFPGAVKRLQFLYLYRPCFMNEKLVQRIAKEVEEIKSSGLYKTERIIESPQGAEIIVNGKTVLNFCANNYLGLSSHPKVIEAAHKAIDLRGYGVKKQCTFYLRYAGYS